jgi:hypothetical protein
MLSSISSCQELTKISLAMYLLEQKVGPEFSHSTLRLARLPEIDLFCNSVQTQKS